MLRGACVVRCRTFATVVACLVLALFGESALAAEPSPLVVSEGPAIQMATLQYVLRSARTGRTYVIKVTSPFGPVRAGEKRPVVYALDGGYEVAGPIAWVVAGAQGMRQSYVVSVGYLPADYHWREPDLAFRAYSDEARKIDSGAPAFRSFLNDELRPFLAGRLPIDDRQAILVGHSAGALFAANILVDNPGEYAGYVIASPAIWTDPSILDRLRAGVSKLRRVKIYVAIGGDETPDMLADARKFRAILSSADSSVALRSETFEGATHLSYYPAMVASALPWMLGR